MKELRLEYRSPEELADNAANYKMHPRAQMVALDSIIGKVGWAGAALYNERTRRLIDGHARKGVAMKKGGKIPVLIGDWSEEEERLILATLDPVGQMYQRVESQYADLTSGLDKAGAEMARSLATAVEKIRPPKTSDDVSPPDEEVIPDTQTGDTWELGPHRLLCGDSTDEVAVAHVLAGVPALQIVDPPFDDTVRFWRSSKAAKRFDPAVLAASGCRTVEDGTRPFSVQEHAGGVLTGYGGMSWGKALVAMEIAMSLIAPGALVWDPCAGSGTSLIAAEKHGRVWRGMEAQPRWCDLIAKRFAEQCGGEPRRISGAA